MAGNMDNSDVSRDLSSSALVVTTNCEGGDKSSPPLQTITWLDIFDDIKSPSHCTNDNNINDRISSIVTNRNILESNHDRLSKNKSTGTFNDPDDQIPFVNDSTEIYNTNNNALYSDDNFGDEYPHKIKINQSLQSATKQLSLSPKCADYTNTNITTQHCPDTAVDHRECCNFVLNKVLMETKCVVDTNYNSITHQNYQLTKCELCGMVMFTFNIIRHTWYHHPNELRDILNEITEQHGLSLCLKKLGNNGYKNDGLKEAIPQTKSYTNKFLSMNDEYLITGKNVHIYRHKYKEICLRAPKTRAVSTRIKENCSKSTSKRVVSNSSNSHISNMTKSQETLSDTNLSKNKSVSTVVPNKLSKSNSKPSVNSKSQRLVSSSINRKDLKIAPFESSTQQSNHYKIEDNNLVVNDNVANDGYISDDSSFSCDDINDTDYIESTAATTPTTTTTTTTTTRNISSHNHNSRKCVSKTKFGSKFKYRKKPTTTTISSSSIQNNVEMSCDKLNLQTKEVDSNNSSEGYKNDCNNTTNVNAAPNPNDIMVLKQNITNSEETLKVDDSFTLPKYHYSIKKFLSILKKPELKIEYNNWDILRLSSCLKIPMLQKMLNDCKPNRNCAKKASKRLRYYYKSSATNQLFVVAPYYSGFSNEVMLSVIFSNNYEHRLQMMSLEYWKICALNVRKIDIRVKDTDQGRYYVTKLILKNCNRMAKIHTRNRKKCSNSFKPRRKNQSTSNTGLTSLIHSIKKYEYPQQQEQRIIDNIMKMNLNGLPSAMSAFGKLLLLENVNSSQQEVLSKSQDLIASNLAKESINKSIGAFNNINETNFSSNDNCSMAAIDRRMQNQSKIISTNISVQQDGNNIQNNLNNRGDQDNIGLNHCNVVISEGLWIDQSKSGKMPQDVLLNNTCKATSAMRSLSNNSMISTNEPNINMAIQQRRINNTNIGYDSNQLLMLQQQQLQKQRFLMKQKQMEALNKHTTNMNVNQNSISISQAIILQQLIQQQQQQPQFDNTPRQMNSTQNTQINPNISVNEKLNYVLNQQNDRSKNRIYISCSDNSNKRQPIDLNQNSNGSRARFNSFNITNNLMNGNVANDQISSNMAQTNNDNKFISKNILNQQILNNSTRFITPEMVQKLSNEELLVLKEYLSRSQHLQFPQFVASKNVPPAPRPEYIKPMIFSSQQPTIRQTNLPNNTYQFSVGNNQPIYNNMVQSLSPDINSSKINNVPYVYQKNKFTLVNQNGVIIDDNKNMVSSVVCNNPQIMSDPNIHMASFSTTNPTNRIVNNYYTNTRNGDILLKVDTNNNHNIYRNVSQNRNNGLHPNLYNTNSNNIINQIHNNNNNNNCVLPNKLDVITSRTFSPSNHHNFIQNNPPTTTTTTVNNSNNGNPSISHVQLNTQPILNDPTVIYTNDNNRFNINNVQSSSQYLNHEKLKLYYNTCIKQQIGGNNQPNCLLVKPTNHHINLNGITSHTNNPNINMTQHHLQKPHAFNNSDMDSVINYNIQLSKNKSQMGQSYDRNDQFYQ